MPKVSIILTSFNHAKYIQEAIDSALNQTFTDFELIIWDDASTDDSWYLINQYSDPRIKAFRNEEQKRGIWGINKAISEIASGEYIAIHHSDDVWESDKLEKQVTFLETHSDIGAVFTNALAITEDGSPLTDEKHFYSNIFNQPNRSRHEWLRFFFFSANALCHPSVLIRKSCYEDCGLYRFGLAQAGDFDMWIRLCLKYEIHVLPERLVRFRVLDDEANTSGSRLETRIRWLYEFYKLMPNYRELTSFEDMVKIFPSATKYYRNEETDLDFVLAMAALEETTSTFIQLFSQDLLFEAISDPKRSANIKRLYDFDYKSFIALTAQRDVFSREEVSTLLHNVSERDGQITDLNQAVAERDGQIGNLNQTVAERDGQIVNLNQAVAERDGQIASLNQAVTERDGQITDLNQTMAERDEQIANLNQAVTERDGQITDLNQTMAERDGQIASLNQAVTERDGQITDLNQTMAERDEQIANLNQAVTERDGQITDLNQTMAERDEQIANLNQAVTERDGQIARLNQTVAGRDQEIAALCDSNSWRITKPLRFVSRLLSGKPKEFHFGKERGLTQQVSPVKQDYRKITQDLVKLPDNFDRDAYLKLNPDVAKGGVDPTTHYLLYGRHEGRSFSLQDLCVDHDFKVERETILRELTQDDLDKLPDDFNPDVYLKLNPDVAKAGVDPTTHYLLYGRHEGRSFSFRELCADPELTQDLDKLPDDFNPDVYLKLNPDVAKAGVDPTTHYLLYGRHEGRSFSFRELCADPELTQDLDKLPDDFDRDVYLKLNPDVAKAGVDPTTHYLLYGRHEGRSFSFRELCADPELTQDLDKLPDDFDRDVYLKLNPDLAESGFDPTSHYLLHGRHEGRSFSLPALDLCAGHEFKPDRETVLVVSHEASRTGAPINSLNIVQTLAERYNVVALLLGGGPLIDAFRLAGAAVMTSLNLRVNPVLAGLIVGQLCERFNFKFALVNSIESRVVLPSLGNYFVPTISLIHEFASYTRPRDAFRDTLFWSGEAVFSTKVTLENALAEYPDLGDRSAHILPQGRSVVPLGELSEEQLEAEREHIRRLMRPKDIAENSVIVLGVGFVQLRKGVDLFIECAARVVRAPEGDRCRFVWIGKGYDPDNDVGYSVYLADQIRRSGIEGHVFFIDETTAIETAYEEADLLLLSSRLDPLPGVAIEAMTHGVPVLCFNKTTGIADFLIDSGLGNDCVAGYLDTADMAEKILALAGSQVLREQVGDRCRVASIAYFSMKEYVARLEILAHGVCDRTQQEKADTQVILASGLFRRDFSCPPHARGQSIETAVRGYVRGWASGIDRRKPFPGFHPGVYLEQYGLTTQGADPFADYLRAGRPDGPWNYPVIVTGEIRKKDLPSNQRVALHIHVYYPELLPAITTRLSRNRICPDLFISITNENVRKLVVKELRDYKGKVVDIQLVPNRGRDIGPFLTAFGQRILTNYDFVGHIHTKKSADLKDENVGKSWSWFLLENLLGGESGSMADSILAKMKDDKSIGMVFPDDPNIIGWCANRAFAESIAGRIGIQQLSEHFIFPVGTMFWAKTSALVPLMNLKLDWDDYPEEPLPYDGTSLHALERLFSLSLSLGNLRCAATNVMGFTR